jgi:lipopolysaccharide export system protein LptA
MKRLHLLSNPFFHSVLGIVCCLLLGSTNTYAIGDSTKQITTNVPIQLKHADSLIGNIREGKKYNKLLGNVQLDQNGTSLNCDSAYLYTDINEVETFGNVHINTNSGSSISSDYLKYNGNTRIAYLKGNAEVIDEANSITAPELTYNLATKVGSYTNGGTLHNDSITLTSNTGTYYGKTKDANFNGDVHVVGPSYTIETSTLKFNTKNKIATFTKDAVVTTDKETIYCKNGTYNVQKGIGNFNSKTVIETETQHIEADKVYSNKEQGITNLTGHVAIEDETEEGTTIYAEKLFNNDKDSTSEAIGKVYIKDNAKQQIIKANRVYRNAKRGELNASGDVYLQDIEKLQELYADKVTRNEKTGESQAIGNVYIIDQKDSQIISAGKIFSNSKTNYTKAIDDVYFYNYKEGRVLKCNQLINEKNVNYTIATGKVYISDSIENTILTCAQFEANDSMNISMAKGKPIIRTLNDKDSLFIRADSFYTAPQSYLDSSKGKRIVPRSVVIGDTGKSLLTAVKDTSKILLGLGHVILFSDSVQAIADTMSYSSIDSTFRLYKKPILWTGESQAIGDTINIYTANNKITRLELLANASLTSFTKASDFYDQVTGNNILGYLENNEIKSLFVDGSAESVYYNKNDKEEFVGLNKSKSSQLRMLFKDKKVDRITFLSDPEGTFLPMDKLTAMEKFLPNFKWQQELRPKEKF